MAGAGGVLILTDHEPERYARDRVARAFLALSVCSQRARKIFDIENGLKSGRILKIS